MSYCTTKNMAVQWAKPVTCDGWGMNEAEFFDTLLPSVSTAWCLIKGFELELRPGTTGIDCLCRSSVHTVTFFRDRLLYRVDSVHSVLRYLQPNCNLKRKGDAA
jgi:hypothetical protein